MARTVVMASAAELVHPHYYDLTQRVHIELNYSGDHVSNEISQFPKREDFTVLAPWGDPWEWHDFGIIIPDGVRRNYSYYKERKADGREPRRYCTRQLLLLLYWDLWLRVKEPERIKAIIQLIYGTKGK